MGAGEWAELVFDDAPDGVLVVDTASGRVLAANPRAGEITGRTLAGLAVDELAIEGLIDREGIAEHSLTRPDGTVTVVEANVRRLDEVAICCLRSLGRSDASRRVLGQSEARLRALFDSTQQVMLLAGLDRRVQAFNAVAAQWARAVLGEPLQEGARLDHILEPVGVELFEQSWSQAIAGDRAFTVAGVPDHDGNTQWFESVYGPVLVGGKVAGVVITAERITERKNAEDALLESERRLELALEGADLGLWDVRLDLGSLQFNENAAAMLGYALEELGTTTEWWAERIVADDWDAALAAFDAHVAGKTPRFEAEMRIRTASGTTRWFRTRGKVTERDEEGRPSRVSGTFVDVEEQKRFETRLQQAERLEALGRLAGGIAHDFNNILSVILGNLPALEPGDPMQSVARDEIREAATRAANLTRQLLAFGRRQPLEVEAVDPAEILRPAESMLRRLLPENIELLTDWRDRGWTVEADRVQLEQVLLNLVLNARDAMTDGGVLRIRLSDAFVEPELAQRFFDRVSGDYVLLEVTDTGVGIDPELLPRIFDPFFTTKELGRGTGLGLATVYGVVTQLGGMIDCDSTPGAGTALRVYLPRARRAPAAPPVERPATSTAGTESILLVEDDRAVRTVLARILIGAGYQVLQAGDGGEALRLLAEKGPVDMVISDVVMPGMSGTDLVAEIRRRAPSMPVLILSGYSDRDLATSENILAKPFTPNDILGRVREVLDEARRRSR